MGSNNSRLNAADGEEMPTRIRPLLRQRMEEFRRRRSGGGGGGGISVGAAREEELAISKKQLLKDDGGAEDGKSQSSDENETGETERKQNAAVRVVEKLSKVVPLPDSECGNEKEKWRGDLKDQEIEKVKYIVKYDKNEEASAKYEEVNSQHKEANVKLEEENAKFKEANAKHEKESTKHHDDDEDEDYCDYEIGRCIGPASPSFKIYCTDADKRRVEKTYEESSIAESESSDNESVASITLSSGNTGSSNEVDEIDSEAPKRKGNKKKKFGGMKKNIFNVKNLRINGMNKMMACTGSSDRKKPIS